MTENLLQAYTPLLLWTGLGLVLVRFMPLAFPRLLGRGLYWVGVPVEIFALARQTDLSELVWLSPLFTGMALLVGMGLAALALWGIRLASRPEYLPVNSSTPGPELFDFAQARKYRGSFILCSMLGNTGFVGLAIATALISNAHLSWAVCRQPKSVRDLRVGCTASQLFWSLSLRSPLVGAAARCLAGAVSLGLPGWIAQSPSGVRTHP